MTTVLIMALCAIATAADAPDTLLQDVAAKRAPVAALVAHFDQQTIMPDDILNASGTIAYSRPRMLAVRFDDPQLVYLIGRDEVREYDGELGQVQIGSLADAPEIEVLFAGFGQSIERLEEAYDVFPFAPVDAPEGAQGLELHPKDQDKESLFESARLYLRPEDMLPYRIEIVNGPDARVIYELSRIEPAAAVDPALFKVDLPPGTRIIANEELVETVGEEGGQLTLGPAAQDELGVEE